MRDFLWRLVARILSRPSIVAWLVRRAARTPDTHIVKDGSTYMMRWWLFNPYDRETRTKRYPRLPSLRMHHILRADNDGHMHDHPWYGRSLVLAGGYFERRLGHPWLFSHTPGSTVLLAPNQFHRIITVSSTGAITLVVLGKFVEDWGFSVDGQKVSHRQYLA